MLNGERGGSINIAKNQQGSGQSYPILVYLFSLSQLLCSIKLVLNPHRPKVTDTTQ
jgi:hypothetical protein